MTHALGSSKTPIALEAKSTNAKAGAAFSVMDEREQRYVMDFPILNAGANASPHLLLFASLHHQGRGISVPCDETGSRGDGLREYRGERDLPIQGQGPLP